MFAHLNHLSQLTLFLVQTRILLLLFSQFGCRIEQKLEVCRVPTILEEVDLCEQLLLLLLQLRDLLLELRWVHALLSKSLGVRVHSLELSLQVLVDLHGVAHLLVVHIFVRDLKRHQELSSVSLSLQVWESTEEPIKNVLECAFLSIDDIAAIVRIEVARIAQNFQESADTLLCLLLRLLLHVNRLMGAVKIGEDSVDKLEELKRGLVVEFYHTKMAHERRAVQTVDNQLNLLCVEVGRLG